jgi:hypothetical protein
MLVEKTTATMALMNFVLMIPAFYGEVDSGYRLL